MMVTGHKYVKVIPENIPLPLRELKRWTVWESVYKKNGKKPSKVPNYNYHNKYTGKYEPRLADLHNPDHLMTFEDAIKMLTAKGSKFQGIQFALDFDKELGEDENRIIGVDLDNVLTPNGDIKPEIIEIIEMFNSYTEFSPSKAGIRIFCYGKFSLDGEVHKGDFEIYQCDKLLTVTGERIITTPESINEAQGAINTFRGKYFKTVDQIDESKLPLTDIIFTDEQVIEKIKDSDKGGFFDKLHYRGAEPSDDLSSIDWAYCLCPVKFTQSEEQIDRLYRSSALMRDKWDRPDGRDGTGPITYGQRTIRNVIRHRGTDIYTSSSENTSLVSIEEFNFDMYPFKVTPWGVCKYEYSKHTDEDVEVQITPTPVIIVAIGENIDNGDILYKLKIKDIDGPSLSD
jgi:primase-polymerase (primpol)-like protein